MNSILQKAMSEGLLVVTEVTATVMSEDDIGAQVTIDQIVRETLEEIEITNCSLWDEIPLDDPKVNKFTQHIIFY